MMEERPQADLHAFVDECLEPARRHAFEAQMAANPALARRAVEWRAQNNAIRMAFGGETIGASSLDLTRRAAGKSGRRSRTPSLDARLIDDEPGFRAGGAAEAARTPDRTGPLQGAGFRLARGLGAIAISLVLVCASATGVRAPSSGLAEAGMAAFAAFALPGGRPVEFATGDPRVAEEWLRGRLARPVRLPSTPAGLGLVGAWVTPASHSAAAFLVYETGRSSVGLLVQRLDAPSPAAPIVAATGALRVALWTDADQGFAVVGGPDEPSFSAIATALYRAPYEESPPAPDRGS